MSPLPPVVNLDPYIQRTGYPPVESLIQPEADEYLRSLGIAIVSWHPLTCRYKHHALWHSPRGWVTTYLNPRVNRPTHFRFFHHDMKNGLEPALNEMLMRGTQTDPYPYPS